MVERERCVASPIHLASTIMSSMWPTNLFDRPSSAHREVERAMLDDADILYVDARGTAKTTLLDEVGSVHELLRRPEATILVTHSVDAQAKGLSRSIRVHFERNERMKRLFPEYAMDEKADAGNVLSWSVPCRRGGGREGSLTVATPGKQTAGMHFSKVRMSDWCNEQTTPLYGAATLEAMQALVASGAQVQGLLLDRSVCPWASWSLDTNRWHDADQAGTIIRGNKAKPSARLRIVERGVKRAPDGTFVPTWPEVQTPESLMEKFESPLMTAETWAANFCSSPMSGEGDQFKPEWFKWRGKDWRDLPPRLKVAIVCDAAWTDAASGGRAARRSDRSAIVVTGVAPMGGDLGGHLFVLHAEAGRWGEDETIERIFAACLVWSPLWFGFEKTNGTRALEKLLLLKMSRDGGRVPFRDLLVSGRGKVARSSVLRAHAQHYGVYVQPGQEELVEELVRKGVADHDDLADALSHAANEDLYPGATPVAQERPVLRMVPPEPPETAESVLATVKARSREAARRGRYGRTA